REGDESPRRRVIAIRGLDDVDGSLLENLRAKKQVQQLYRRLDATQEWAEDNYYHLPIQQQTADLVAVNPFWLDYARHYGRGPPLPRHRGAAPRTSPDMLRPLAALALPSEPAKHALKPAGTRLTLTPAGPAVAFHEEVRPTGAPGGRVPVLLSQNFYR